MLIFGLFSSDRPIRFKCGLLNTILDVLRNRPGWEEVKAYYCIF